MNEEIITLYTFILIKEEDNNYLGWSKAPTVKKAGDGMRWVEWNKPLPEDIDTIPYKYGNGELKAV